MMSLRSCLRRFLRREHGNASIEFVFFMPLMFAILVITMEVGTMMVRHTGLERAMDIVMRQIRLGQIPTVTATSLRTEICRHVFLAPRCNETTVVELTRIDRATFALPTTTTPCVTRSATAVNVPLVTVTPGQSNALMLVRVCMVTNALLPRYLVAAPVTYDAQGGYSLTTSSAFVVEP